MQLGHDVELFVTEQETGKIFPGNEFEELYREVASKQEQEKLSVKHDNVMVELNCDPIPYQHFSRAILNQSSILHKNIGKINDMPYQIPLTIAEPSLYDATSLVGNKYFNEFNCRPALNIWDKKNINPDTEGMGTSRLSGGHIHFETNNPDEVKVLDASLGILETFELMDNLALRKKVGYGKAGNCRIREHPDKTGKYEYIVEYRTLSSNWWWNRDATRNMEKLFKCLRHIPEFSDGTIKFAEIYQKEIMEAIDNLNYHKGEVVFDCLLDFWTKEFTEYNSFEDVPKSPMFGRSPINSMFNCLLDKY